jgi:hypothetical protein
MQELCNRIGLGYEVRVNVSARFLQGCTKHMHVFWPEYVIDWLGNLVKNSMPVRELCSGMTLGKSNLFYPK